MLGCAESLNSSCSATSNRNTRKLRGQQFVQEVGVALVVCLCTHYQSSPARHSAKYISKRDRPQMMPNNDANNSSEEMLLYAVYGAPLT
eukprot:98430-Amphidinium_carterae.2